MSAIDHELSLVNSGAEVDTRPNLTLILGGESQISITEPELTIAEDLGKKATKGMDMRLAYMPGPPVWDLLKDSPHLVRGIVYPH